MSARKLLLLGLLALAVAAFVALDLGRWLSLAQLQQSQAQLQALVQARPLAAGAAYLALYVAVTALSLPGAVVLTLAGGALFGLLWGTLLVSFASSIGATLAFLVARHLLRDSVEARFGTRLAEINRGVDKDGAFYLFTLRLILVVPFFIINLVMGLTRMRAATFYAASQLGMLVGTVVYVNAGTQLAQIRSPGDVLSPALIGSFVLLGLFPLLARRLVEGARQRRVFARWAGQRPRSFDRNLVVIGAGAGGLVTAYIAAAVQARVTLVEARHMGGDCLNFGCVPSKALIRSARLAHQMRQADRWGLSSTDPGVRWPAVMARVRQVIADIAPHDSVERYQGLGVEVLQGYARIVNPWTVEVALNDGGTQRLSTRAIVIAAGAEPIVPPLPGLAELGCVTSDTLWDRWATLDAPPRRIAVLGGGPIGCELAQALQRLGAQVTLVEQAPRLMGREDDDAAALVQQALQGDGVRVLAGHTALRVQAQVESTEEPAPKWLILRTPDGGELAVPADEIVCAVGRRARLTGYGLEELGIPAQRTIETNEFLQTLYPHIYAVGDVAGPYQFTHVAAHQAWYAAVNALFGDLRRYRADYSVIPWCTFTDPEVARVGLSEREAAERGIAVEVTRYGLDDLDRAIADGEAHGFVKVLTAPGSDRILGATIAGPHAAELLAELVLAMRHGIGLNKLLGTIHLYPSWAEANKYAAGAWKRAHAPQGLLRWARRFHDWRRG